jgi:hypothetical protein
MAAYAINAQKRKYDEVGTQRTTVAVTATISTVNLPRCCRCDTVVDTAGEFVHAETIPAEVLFEQGQFQFSQITYSLYSKLRQLVSCNFADYRRASDRKRQQKQHGHLRSFSKGQRDSNGRHVFQRLSLPRPSALACQSASGVLQRRDLSPGACNRDQRTGSVVDTASEICGAVVPSK